MLLTTPIACLRQFINPADRAYYARPVRVQPLFCELDTRLVFVHDPEKGRTFPVDPKNLKPDPADKPGRDIICSWCPTFGRPAHPDLHKLGVSHGVCPDCERELHQQLDEEERRTR